MRLILSTRRDLLPKKQTFLRDSTVQTTSKSVSKQNNIPDLTPPILTPTNPTMSNCADVGLHAKKILGDHDLMSNNINKLKRKCDMCNNIFKSPMHC